MEEEDITIGLVVFVCLSMTVLLKFKRLERQKYFVVVLFLFVLQSAFNLEYEIMSMLNNQIYFDKVMCCQLL